MILRVTATAKNSAMSHLAEITVGVSSVGIFVYMFLIGGTAAGGILLALLPVLVYVAWRYLSYSDGAGGQVS